MVKYKTAESLKCTVVRVVESGYEVRVERDDVNAFLPTPATLAVGDEIQALFVCIHNGRILVTARFSKSVSDSSES